MPIIVIKNWIPTKTIFKIGSGNVFSFKTRLGTRFLLLLMYGIGIRTKTITKGS